LIVVMPTIMAQPPDKSPPNEQTKKATKTRPPIEVFVDPNKAGPDFAIQGEYISIPTDQPKCAAQVIAKADGRFDILLLAGGLPGAGWNEKPGVRLAAERRGELVTIVDPDFDGVIVPGQMSLNKAGTAWTLHNVQRVSPTIGRPPPPNAKILFDGTSADLWERGRVVEGNLLRCGATTKAMFGDFQLHLEFRTPFVPRARGQNRGNSGVYLQGRYEVQILDSFGLEGKNNECGGIYETFAPRINMCFPPLSWQTYDIDFRAARVENGKKVADAEVTVRHNDVVIHDRVKIPGLTGNATRPENGTPGPITLQDHGTLVVFRNIWVVETK
jgi:hypothetical protein